MDRPLNLKPCQRCKKKKVLHPGDYCNLCATQWESRTSEYFVVNPETLDDVAEVSGVDRAYLKAKQESAFERACVYVIFYGKETWNEIVISERFYLPKVMENLLSRLEDQ